ncbi:MAG: glycine--tRNA ligase subunit beta [Deltaproteobacteria bacterium]|nr:glycine--tRNA ligase subunit beta [Deltaproteobacteria bacterium]
MNLLLEIGCEEIPARFIPPGLQALADGLSKLLADARLNDPDSLQLKTLGTPRRLALIAEGLPERQPDLEEEILGPKVEVAFDADGKPTKACLGFAKSKGADPVDLLKVDTPKGKVVAIKRQISGSPTIEVLPGLLKQLLANLSFPKTMRWGTGEYSFARPLHWILALLDRQVVPFEFAGVQADKYSRGHRFVAPGPFEVSDPNSYIETLEAHQVLVEPEKRRSQLMQQARKLSKELDGQIIEDQKLEEEVTFLTERPVPLLGRFDEEFLRLPRNVLIAAMRNHQRYFSVEDENHNLINAFVAIGNTPVEDPDLVRHGFERVLTARLSDANFFYETDQKKPPSELILALKDMVFQADLGSYYAKTKRVSQLAEEIAGKLADSLETENLAARVNRAAWLAKTDLLTEMVGEFPELQGQMGGVYAELAGEDNRVAQAIEEHYRPRFADDEIPKSHEGAIVSLADRLDTLAGCFGVGLRPTGTADPYALRRQCLGVLAILAGKQYHLSFSWLLQRAVGLVKDKVAAALLEKARKKERKAAARKKRIAKEISTVEPFEEKLIEDLNEFVKGRLRVRLAGQARTDLVDSVLAAGIDDIPNVHKRLQALAEFITKPGFEDLAIAFKRVANIIKDFPGAQVNESLFAEEEENDLFKVFTAVAPKFEAFLAEGKFDRSVALLASEFRAPVDRFFDKVLVNVPDNPELQNNRKALLAEIEKLFSRIADFTRLQLKGSQ